jgi:hypothetical protein
MLRNSDSGPEIGHSGWFSVGLLFGGSPKIVPLAAEPILMFSRLDSGRHSGRKFFFRPASMISQHRVPPGHRPAGGFRRFRRPRGSSWARGLATYPMLAAPHDQHLLMSTVCYPIVLPGRKSGSGARFLQDSDWDSLNIGSPAAGWKPA